MSTIAVSPRYTSLDMDGADLAKKIDIFEDQMRGWFLNHADVLASATNPHCQHAGFAILTLLIVYAEAVACFIKGTTSDGRSEEFFTFGLGEILPGFNDPTRRALTKDLYKQVRCGQLHQGLVRGKASILRGGTAALTVTSDATTAVPTAIQIDPWLLLEAVRRHLDSYVTTLRDPAAGTERANFETWFEARADNSALQRPALRTAADVDR